MNYFDRESGRVEGISTQLIEAIFQEAGYEYTLAILPWNRAYRDTLSNRNTCLFTTVRTPDREEKFKWVGPLFVSGWAFYQRAGGMHFIEDVADLRGKVVVATSATVAISGIADIPGIQNLEVPTDQRALVLLNEGRADLWVSGVFTAFVGGDQAGVVPELVFLWRPIELSLACNIQTHSEIIARLNAANQRLDSLRAKLKAEHYYFSHR